MYGLTSSMLAGDTYKAFELAPRILAGFVAVVWDHNDCTSSGGGRSPDYLCWWHGSMALQRSCSVHYGWQICHDAIFDPWYISGRQRSPDQARSPQRLRALYRQSADP